MMRLDPLTSWLEPRRLQTVAGAPPSFLPPTDLLAGEDDVKVVMDVPGLTAADLEIELSDGTLAIRGERPYPYREHEGSHHLNRLERGFGRFERILKVPRDVDAGAIEASVEAGILTLSIPMPESRKPHRIEIRSGAEAATIAVEAESDDGASAERNGRRELAGAAA